MKILKRFSLLILLIGILAISILPASASDANSLKNISTYIGDIIITGVPNGSSTVVFDRNLWKISVYMVTSDDFPIDASGNIDMAKVDINSLAKFGKSIYISNKNNTYRNMAAYTNVATDKFDAIKSLNNGQRYAPSYKLDGSYYQISSNNGKLVYASDYPSWWINNNISSAEGESYFSNAANIYDLIRKIANQYGSGSSTNDKINFLLSQIDFNYNDDNGNPIEINYRHIYPVDTNENFLVPLVLVVEPAFYYNEDPSSMVSGNKMFAMTATDCYLTELAYPNTLSGVRFLTNTKKYMQYYCSTCNRSWVESNPNRTYDRCIRARYWADLLDQSGLQMDGAAIEDMREIFDCTSSVLMQSGIEKKMGGELKKSAWYPFSIISCPKILSRMSPDKIWLNNFITPATSDDYAKFNATLYTGLAETDAAILRGGYGVFAFGYRDPEENKAILEIKAVDSGLNSISGLKVLAGISPNQGEEVVASNYSRMVQGMNQNTAEFSAIKAVFESIKAIASGSSWKNLLQVAAETAEDYIPLAFDISKMGIPESDISAFGLNRMRNMLSNIEAFVAVSKNNIPSIPNGKIILYSDDLIAKYKEISKNLKEENNISSLIAEYSVMVAELENEHKKYFEGNMDGKNKNPSQIIAEDGSIIKIASSLSPIISSIGDTSWIALIGDNANLYNIGRIYISEDEIAKASILIPAIICDKIEIEEENSNQDIILGGDTSKIMLPNELIKGFNFESNLNQGISVSERIPNTTCPGWEWDSYEDEEEIPCPKAGTDEECTETHPHTKKVTKWRQVDCEHSAHDIDNKISFDIDSVFVEESYFLNSSMLNGIDKLAVLRNGTAKNGVNFSFNTGSYSTTDIDDIYSQVTDYSFMSHRNANGTPLALASYYNFTNANKAFKSFISNYYPNYPESYDSQNGSFGANVIQVDTEISAPNDAAISGTLDACSGDSAYHNNLDYGEISGDFKTSSSIEVLPIGNLPSNENQPTTLAYEYVNSEYLRIRIPSNLFEFNPAFKMIWYDSSDNSNPQSVWVIGKNTHTFQGADLIEISINSSSTSIKGSFSRDSEDLQQSLIDNMPTLKSGSTVAAENTTQLIITATIHLQDPAFVGSSGSTVYLEAQNRNNQIIQEYDAYINSLIQGFANGENISFFSNMFGASDLDGGTVHGLKIPYGWEDLSEKTQFKIPSVNIVNQSISNSAYYISSGIAPERSNRSINILGKSVAINRKWDDTRIIASTARLNQLLNKNDFIQEEYSGLIILKRIYTINLEASSDYIQIHPRLSDSRTARDYYASELKFAGLSNEYLVSWYGKSYIIGAEFRFNSEDKKINGFDIPNLYLAEKNGVAKFHIKGSIYDLS